MHGKKPGPLPAQPRIGQQFAVVVAIEMSELAEQDRAAFRIEPRDLSRVRIVVIGDLHMVAAFRPMLEPVECPGPRWIVLADRGGGGLEWWRPLAFVRD